MSAPICWRRSSMAVPCGRRSRRRSMPSTEPSLRLTRTTCRYGNVGILQVLDAQRQAEQARLGYVRAQAQRYLDSITLFTAMGGGWRDWQAQTGSRDGGEVRRHALSRRWGPVHGTILPVSAVR